MAGVYGQFKNLLNRGRTAAMRYHDGNVAQAIMSGGGSLWKGNLGRSVATNAGIGAAYGGVTDGDNRVGGAFKGAFMGAGAGLAYRGALHGGIKAMGAGKSAAAMNSMMRMRSLGYRSTRGFAKGGYMFAKGTSGALWGSATSRFRKKAVPNENLRGHI